MQIKKPAINPFFFGVISIKSVQPIQKAKLSNKNNADDYEFQEEEFIDECQQFRI